MKQLSMFMVAITMLLLSCGRGKEYAAQVKEEDQVSAKVVADTVAISSNAIPPQASTHATYEDWNKKIIKTANVSLELKDFNAYNRTIHANIKNYGAYIAEEEQTLNAGRLENKITIKVPVTMFDDLMSTFNQDSTFKVIEKKITSQDVSGQVVETKARLEAKKQVREQYLALLHQAKNMKDIIEIQNQVNTIQEDIEGASGRINYLTTQSAYSTIYLSYYQFNTDVNTDTPQPGFFKDLQNAFSNGGKVIGNIIVCIVTIWPLILIAFVALFLWKKRKMQPAITTPKEKQ